MVGLPAPLPSAGCGAVVSPFEICASLPPFSTRFPPTRNCIGEKFALLEAKTILAMLYCAFEFEYASSTPEQVGGVGLAAGCGRAAVWAASICRCTCNRTAPPVCQAKSWRHLAAKAQSHPSCLCPFCR